MSQPTSQRSTTQRFGVSISLREENSCDDRLPKKPFTLCQDLIIYSAIIAGAGCGASAFLTLFGIGLYFLGAGPTMMTASMIICIPSLLAAPLFTVWGRHRFVLINSPRGILWVVGSITCHVARLTFLAPCFLLLLPTIACVYIVKNRFNAFFPEMKHEFDSRLGFQTPAH